MRRIKKYSNRKLYDTTDKKYISLQRVAELVAAGEQVHIMDSKTGEDLTSATISQILAREKSVPSNVLMQLLQKGQGTFQGTVAAARRYVSVWQSAFTMAEGEIDRLISRMIKNNELPESEGSSFKKEMLCIATNLRTWISEKIDQSVKETLSMMNLATKDQVQQLRLEAETLRKKVEELEAALEQQDRKHA